MTAVYENSSSNLPSQTLPVHGVGQSLTSAVHADEPTIVVSVGISLMTDVDLNRSESVETSFMVLNTVAVVSALHVLGRRVLRSSGSDCFINAG